MIDDRHLRATASRDSIESLLASVVAAPGWMRGALCAEPAYREVDFFARNTEEARAVCARCSVADECAAYAVELGISDGMWGGIDGGDRRSLRREAG